MLSHDYRYIFLHIPKTGGLSVIDALKPFCDWPDHQCTGGFGHPRQSEYYKDDIDNYYQFSFVRNPFSRIVSSYFYLKQGGICEFDEGIRDRLNLKEKSFKQFALDLDPENSGPHCRRQLSYMDRNIDKVNWFHMEDYQNNFNIVCDMIGIPRQKLPHKNTTKHKHYTEYYDDESIDAITRKYSCDIERFGYKYGD